MGYLVTAHIVPERPRIDRLAGLPPSIGWRIYHHRSADVYVFDVFHASRPPDYPFRTPVPTADISLDLPGELRDLELVCAFLYKRRLANSFKKSHINFGLLLNRFLGAAVHSFISNDDEWDFACTAAEGALSRLKCQCGDLVITFESGTTHIQPLLSEFEEDDDLLTNLEDLRAALPSVLVADRDVKADERLHAIAIEEWRRFSGSEGTILGLGTFDLPTDEPDWELIANS